MIKSIVNVKNVVKDLAVIKNTCSPLYCINQMSIFKKRPCEVHKDKVFEKCIYQTKKERIVERKWDFDMDGNPYYCDGKAT